MKIAVQTVPARSALVGMLLRRVPNAVVYTDNECNGSLWNMERILFDSPEGVLILQDDVALPEWFLLEVEKAIVPGWMMSFFMGMTNELKGLYDAGLCYAKTQNVWGQANYYPPLIVKEYSEWSIRQPNPSKRGEEAKAKYRKFSGDDSSVCEFLRKSKRHALLTLPNLVNHQQVPSALGHPMTVRGLPRTSMLFGKALLREWDHNAIGKLSR